jgi:hypothetical protein
MKRLDEIVRYGSKEIGGSSSAAGWIGYFITWTISLRAAHHLPEE